MPSKKNTARPPAQRSLRPKSPHPARAVLKAQESAPASTPAGIARQVSTAAMGLLSISTEVVGAARGLQVASSAARALGSGSPAKAARLVLDALGGGSSSGAHRGAAKAGQLLKEFREAAGLTLGDVNAGLGLPDHTMLGAFESGKLRIPFELILRLAAIMGRNDPVGFVMKLTRNANPDIWKTLEALGIGRLVLQSAREREFANVLRADDAARLLSDDDFAEVLAFVKAAFELAMALRSKRR